MRCCFLVCRPGEKKGNWSELVYKVLLMRVESAEGYLYIQAQISDLNSLSLRFNRCFVLKCLCRDT